MSQSQRLSKSELILLLSTFAAVLEAKIFGSIFNDNEEFKTTEESEDKGYSILS